LAGKAAIDQSVASSSAVNSLSAGTGRLSVSVEIYHYSRKFSHKISTTDLFITIPVNQIHHISLGSISSDRLWRSTLQTSRRRHGWSKIHFRADCISSEERFFRMRTGIYPCVAYPPPPSTGVRSAILSALLCHASCHALVNDAEAKLLGALSLVPAEGRD
jgi:hypothetical protein